MSVVATNLEILTVNAQIFGIPATSNKNHSLEGRRSVPLQEVEASYQVQYEARGLSGVPKKNPLIFADVCLDLVRRSLGHRLSEIELCQSWCYKCHFLSL